MSMKHLETIQMLRGTDHMCSHDRRDDFTWYLVIAVCPRQGWPSPWHAPHTRAGHSGNLFGICHRSIQEQISLGR